LAFFSDILDIENASSHYNSLLFILYVNDMPQCFTQCQVNIYADDTAFYVAKRTVQEVNTVLQTELDLVHQWLCANKLSLHVGKTVSMLFYSRQKRIHLKDESKMLYRPHRC
jgi:hypothetical protein